MASPNGKNEIEIIATPANQARKCLESRVMMKSPIHKTKAPLVKVNHSPTLWDDAAALVSPSWSLGTRLIALYTKCRFFVALIQKNVARLSLKRRKMHVSG